MWGSTADLVNEHWMWGSFSPCTEADQCLRQLWSFSVTVSSSSAVALTPRARLSMLQHNNPSSCQTREEEPKDYPLSTQTNFQTCSSESIITTLLSLFVSFSSVMYWLCKFDRVINDVEVRGLFFAIVTIIHLLCNEAALWNLINVL